MWREQVRTELRGAIKMKRWNKLSTFSEVNDLIQQSSPFVPTITPSFSCFDSAFFISPLLLASCGVLVATLNFVVFSFWLVTSFKILDVVTFMLEPQWALIRWLTLVYQRFTFKETIYLGSFFGSVFGVSLTVDVLDGADLDRICFGVDKICSFCFFSTVVWKNPTRSDSPPFDARFEHFIVVFTPVVSLPVNALREKLNSD